MKTDAYDVVVVGNVGIDTNVYFDGEPNFDVESNYTENIDCVGQAGGYSARGFAQLGYRTAFIGYVGDDYADKILISGMGEHGCALSTRQGIKYYKAVDLPEPVIDTNGAGDGLAVGFTLSYLLENYSLPAAILRGQITARWTCTQRATSAHLMTKAKLDEIFTKMTGGHP